MKIPWSQILPPAPSFTAHSIPDLAGKIFIVTGGSSGIGFALSSLLYAHNGTVYIATRSETKALAAISAIETGNPDARGRLEYLHLDLADLAGVKGCVDGFLGREMRLDALWCNAGVFVPPVGSRSAQNHELQLGTNCLGHFLLTSLLLPLLRTTAASSPAGSVRVVWTASMAVDMIDFGKMPGGMDVEALQREADGKGTVEMSPMEWYALSKVGNLFLGGEMARREADVMSLIVNPGNIKSPMQRHMRWWTKILARSVAYEPIYGAYTEAFAGLSDEITMENRGAYIHPWGRIGVISPELAVSLKGVEEGGNGKARAFWEFCERVTRDYA